MADFTTYSPVNLDNLDTTVPTSAEDAAKLFEAIQQTRKILSEIFQKEHNKDGTHKSVVEGLPDGGITGNKIQSSASDNGQRAIGRDHIKDESISKEKLAKFSIAETLLEDGAASTRVLKDLSVATSKIGSKQVTSEKIADKAVGDSQLGDKAVKSRAIDDEGVGTDQIKEKAVTASKVSLAEALMLVGTAGGGALACAIGGQLEIKSIDVSEEVPVVNFGLVAGEGTLVPLAVISEIGSDGGSPVANTWNVRPLVSTSQMSVRFDPTDMIHGGPKTFRFREQGTYLIFVVALAYKTDLHQIRIRNITRDQSMIVGVLTEADNLTNAQIPSVGMGVAQVRDAGEEFQFQHWVQTATNAKLGRVAVSTGEAQTFLGAIFLKL